LLRIDRFIGDVDFYRPDHRAIFGAIRALAEEGQPHDVITVQEKLTRAEKLETAGGFDYLGKLARETATPANIVTYAEVLRERTNRRKVLKIGRELAMYAEVLTDRPLVDVVTETQRQLTELLAPLTPVVV
jgi:replicative DNA helicase